MQDNARLRELVSARWAEGAAEGPCRAHVTPALHPPSAPLISAWEKPKLSHKQDKKADSPCTKSNGPPERGVHKFRTKEQRKHEL